MNGYKLSFSANNLKVSLGNTSISAVNGLDHPVQVEFKSIKIYDDGNNKTTA